MRSLSDNENIQDDEVVNEVEQGISKVNTIVAGIEKQVDSIIDFFQSASSEDRNKYLIHHSKYELSGTYFDYWISKTGYESLTDGLNKSVYKECEGSDNAFPLMTTRIQINIDGKEIIDGFEKNMLPTDIRKIGNGTDYLLGENILVLLNKYIGILNKLETRYHNNGIDIMFITNNTPNKEDILSNFPKVAGSIVRLGGIFIVYNPYSLRYRNKMVKYYYKESTSNPLLDYPVGTYLNISTTKSDWVYPDGKNYKHRYADDTFVDEFDILSGVYYVSNITTKEDKGLYAILLTDSTGSTTKVDQKYFNALAVNNYRMSVSVANNF